MATKKLILDYTIIDIAVFIVTNFDCCMYGDCFIHFLIEKTAFKTIAVAPFSAGLLRQK